MFTQLHVLWEGINRLVEDADAQRRCTMIVRWVSLLGNVPRDTCEILSELVTELNYSEKVWHVIPGPLKHMCDLCALTVILSYSVFESQTWLPRTFNKYLVCINRQYEGFLLHASFLHLRGRSQGWDNDEWQRWMSRNKTRVGSYWTRTSLTLLELSAEVQLQ